uniref:BAR domain-containing protein n=1 Tax=Meloidogyne javanica TaxID=6303 RepID=A0A915M366_MELJA
MQLKPLEFSECLTDSPFFRQNLHKHEIALEQTSKKIKDVEQQCRKILSYSTKLSLAQKHLAETLSDFKLGMIGTMSEDDMAMANYTKQLANVIIMIEEHRSKTIQETGELYLSPLLAMVEKINRARDGRQRYSEINDKILKAKENFEVQQIEANELKKKMLVTFMRNSVFQSETDKSGNSNIGDDGEPLSPGALGGGAISSIKQGYLYMHDPIRLLPKTISRDVLSRSNWTKYYCVYSRETKIFTFIPTTNVVKTVSGS